MAILALRRLERREQMFLCGRSNIPGGMDAADLCQVRCGNDISLEEDLQWGLISLSAFAGGLLL